MFSNTFDPQPFVGAEQQFWSVKRKTNPAWAINLPTRPFPRIRRSQFVPLCSSSLIQGLYTLSFIVKCSFCSIGFSKILKIFWNVWWEKFKNEVDILFWNNVIIFDIVSIFHYILGYKDNSLFNSSLLFPFNGHWL